MTPRRRVLTRRALLGSAGAALAVLAAHRVGAAPARPAVTVYKSPT